MILFLFVGSFGFSQKKKSFQRTAASNGDIESSIINFEISGNDSVQFLFYPQVCKRLPVIILYETRLNQNGESNNALHVNKIPLLQIHGNVLYNFSYRSYIDTPFAQTGVIQNLIQTNLKFLIRNKYPLSVSITNRNSNSPYFKNITDVNFNYNRGHLLENIKSNLKEKLAAIGGLNGGSEIGKDYMANKKRAREIKDWLNDPHRSQEIIEEKERKLTGKTNKNPASSFNWQNRDLTLDGMETRSFTRENKGRSNIWEELPGSKAKAPKDFSADSIPGILGENKLSIPDSSAMQKIESKKQELTRLLELIEKEKKIVRKGKQSEKDSLQKLEREINGINNSNSLYSYMKRHGISKDSLNNLQKVLLSINQIGIGRNMINYSELTVKNISLTGGNIEVNPHNFYFAAAGGKVNYRFRDFIVKQNIPYPEQSLYLLRAGIGKKEKNNFIVTFYKGKKAELWPNVNTPARPQKVLGVSVEGRFILNDNNYLIAEVAKSSYNNNSVNLPTNLLKKAFDLKVHTNEAYSIKLFSQYPATNTRISAHYKKMGHNFQSFNLYPTGINQSAWMVKVNQRVWKQRISVEAAVRKNEYSGGFALPSSYSAKTIFKSLQASFRYRKYPFVSIGYYPSSQLSLGNNNVLTVNQYNTLNVIIAHSYRVKETTMSTNAMYTRFYNNSTDSGFIYFNARNYSINHSIFLSHLSIESGINIISEKDLRLVTIGQSLSYNIKNNIVITAGLKWSRINKEQNEYGGNSSIRIRLHKLGTIQFDYDKSFLPAYNHILKPVDIGRVSFYRDF